MNWGRELWHDWSEARVPALDPLWGPRPVQWGLRWDVEPYVNWRREFGWEGHDWGEAGVPAVDPVLNYQDALFEKDSCRKP